METLEDRFEHLNASLRDRITVPSTPMPVTTHRIRTLPVLAAVAALALLLGLGLTTVSRAKRPAGLAGDSSTAGAWLVASGDSMEPTIPADSRVVVSRDVGTLTRGTLVSTWPTHDGRNGVRRIVGLPGETVDIVDGAVVINGSPLHETYLADGQATPRPDNATAVSPAFRALPVTLSGDEYFLLGDNRAVLDDSRTNGPIDRSEIFGRFLRTLDGPTQLPQVFDGFSGTTCTAWTSASGAAAASMIDTLRRDPATSTLHRVLGDQAVTLLRKARPDLDTVAGAGALTAIVVTLGLPTEAIPFQARTSAHRGIIAVACTNDATVSVPVSTVPSNAVTSIGSAPGSN